MKLTLGKNLLSQTALSSLQQNSNELSQVYERLASGQRINKASDDPAGLALSSSLLTDTRLLGQAIRNVNDGVSLLNVTESALSELKQIILRQQELAEQAANGSYSPDQRAILATEANVLSEEFNRIVASTDFNGHKLLDRSLSSLNLGVGTKSTDVLSFALGEEFVRVVGDGTFGDETQYTTSGGNNAIQLADVNNDSKLDIVNHSQTEVSVLLGNGDGTFQAFSSNAVGNSSSGTTRGLTLGDFNGDRNIDIASSDADDSTISILLGNGDGTFQARYTYAALASTSTLKSADFTGDGNSDLLVGSDGALGLLLGNENGTFTSMSTLTGASGFDVDIGDFNRDGKVDIISSSSVDGISLYTGNGDGTFNIQSIDSSVSTTTQIVATDLNNDGYDDIAVTDYNSGSGTSLLVYLNQADGTFSSSVSYATLTGPYSLTTGDVNGDGYNDVVAGTPIGGDGAPHFAVHLGQGDGTLGAAQTINADARVYGLDLGDLDGDGGIDLVAADALGAASSVSVLLANTQEVNTAPLLDLYSQEGARAALDFLDDALTRVSGELSSIGASQSRLEAVMNNLNATRSLFEEAATKFTDIDVAEDAAKLVRLGILQQAGVALMAQANQTSALVLGLLQ